MSPQRHITQIFLCSAAEQNAQLLLHLLMEYLERLVLVYSVRCATAYILGIFVILVCRKFWLVGLTHRTGDAPEP